MARTAAVPDETAEEIARRMLGEGTLTQKALREACLRLGGMDNNRCGPIIQKVKREADEARQGAELLNAAGEKPSSVPAEVRDAITRVFALVEKNIRDVQREEMARARIQEDALRAEHAREVAVLRREQESLRSKLEEFREQAAQCDLDRTETRARILELEGAAGEAATQHKQELLQAQTDRRRVEGLLESATAAERRANEERARADLARSTAESELMHARQALEDQRQEMIQLRAQAVDLERRLSTAERDRDVALAKADAALQRAEQAERREEASIRRFQRTLPPARNTKTRRHRP